MKDGGGTGQKLFDAHPRSELKRRAVRGWLVTMASQGAKLLLNIASVAVLARLLTPSDYGVVAMVASVLAFITVFKDLGLSTAMIQREQITPEQVSGLFWINVAVSLLFSAIIALCAPLIAWFYGRPELFWITLAYAAMSPLSGLAAQHQALLQRSMRYGSLAVRDLLALLAGVAAGIAAATAGLQYWSLVIMQATSAVTGLAALWWQSGWRPQAPRWHPDLLSLLKFGGAVTASNVLGYVMNGLDSVLLGFFFGADALGFYNRAQHLVKQPIQQFMPPLMSVATSTFSRLRQDPPAFRRSAGQLLSALACVTGLAVVAMIATGPWLVELLLGPRWSQSIPIFSALALFAFVEPCASLTGTLLVVSGRPGQLVRWRIISAPIVVISLLVGLPWGVTGVALSFALAGLLIRAPLFLVFTARALRWSTAEMLRTLAAPVFSGMLTLALLYFALEHWTPTKAWNALLGVGLSCVVLYLGLLACSARTRNTISWAWKLLAAARTDKSPKSGPPPQEDGMP